MIFKEIQFENFFSFGPKTERLDLFKQGLFLIIGINGAGKSAILDAICFALFGKVTKDVNLPDIVNEQTGIDCRVELSFEVNGSDYWIVRYRKHKKFYDIVKLYKGSKEEKDLISKANKSDTQELINKLININFKSFINAVMLSGEVVDSFLEADPWKKKEIIENILQLEIITKYHWIAQQKRKLLKSNINSIDLEILNLENLINSIKQSMIDYIESCRRQKKEKDDKLEEFKKKLYDINATNITLELEKIKESELLAQDIEQKMTEYQQVSDKSKSLNNEKETLENSLLEYTGFIKSNKERIINIKKAIKETNIEVNNLHESIKIVKENPEKCPVCENNINEDKINKWITENEEKIEQHTLSVENENITLENISGQLANFKEKVKDLNKTIDNFDDQITQNNEEAESIKKEYESIEIPKTKDEEYLRVLSDNKTKIKARIKELEKKNIIDKEYLHSLKNQGLEISESLREKRADLKKSKKQFIIMEWWENSLSSKKNSMKSWCINNIIGYFNARIKYYMDRFFDGDITIQMDIELNEKINRLGKDRTFGMFSRGEKRRLNLAILFALYSLVKANISTKINIMFLDEILSNHLDDKGISVVLELLEEMKDNKETVFIIEHRENFKDYPSFKPIQVYKDNHEFSHIKVI